MKKTILSLLLIIIVLAAVIFSVVLINKLAYAPDGGHHDTFEVFGSAEKIVVSVDVGYINIIKTDSELSVSTVEPSEGFYIKDLSDGVLTIRMKPTKWYDSLKFYGIDRFGINISVPDGFDGDIELSGASGDISIDRLDISSLSAALASGNIIISRANVKKLQLETASGNITLDGISAQDGGADISMTTASGNIDAYFLFGRSECSLSSSSASGVCSHEDGGDGNISITSSSASGNITYEFTE